MTSQTEILSSCFHGASNIATIPLLVISYMIPNPIIPSLATLSAITGCAIQVHNDYPDTPWLEVLPMQTIMGVSVFTIANG